MICHSWTTRPLRALWSRARAALALLLAAALVAGCAAQGGGQIARAPAPPTQDAAVASAEAPRRPPTRRLTLEEEARIGEIQNRYVLREYGGAYADARLSGYVESVGLRIATVTERPSGPWTFTVLDSPIVNAFALPGGYVYVTRGLVALANDEAELASVLAHEMAHVTQMHPAERFEALKDAETYIGRIGAGARAAGDDPRRAVIAAAVAAQGELARFSRRQELEADRIGVRYLARAGYAPTAQAEFLAKMEAQDRLNRRLAGASPLSSVSFFATHPTTAARTRQALEAAATERRGPGVRRADAFLNAVDGVAYGPRGLYRIRVATVRAGDTVAGLARRTAFTRAPVAQFRVLNGLGPNDRLRPGQRVKLAVR